MPDLTYYVTYSMTTDAGPAVGRSQITCEFPIDCMRRVEEVERLILDDRKRNDPSARSLFLTWWAPINPDPQ